MILCGDHLQLPPTVKSRNASELAFTLFDKLHDKFSGAVPSRIAMLDTQYRMNHKICAFFSDHLYGGKLRSHESVANHLLSDLEYVGNESRSASVPLMIVDSAGLHEFQEDAVEHHVSKSNEAEAEIVAKHVGILKSAGVETKAWVIST